MYPITISSAQYLVDLLTAGAAIEAGVNSLAAENGIAVPVIPASQVYVSSAPAGLADLQQELGYPRVSVYSSRLKNSQIEKFRSISGSVTVTAEIAATGDLLTDVDLWIHFYVEVITTILQQNRGDWGDGLFYSGVYDVELQAPKPGGSGFLQLAHVNFEVGVSRN
jgi:hypothetical protein